MTECLPLRLSFYKHLLFMALPLGWYKVLPGFQLIATSSLMAALLGEGWALVLISTVVFAGRTTPTFPNFWDLLYFPNVFTCLLIKHFPPSLWVLRK